MKTTVNLLDSHGFTITCNQDYASQLQVTIIAQSDHMGHGQKRVVGQGCKEDRCRQSSSMCTPAQFDALLSANSCHKGEKVTKCVRRLLSHVHPDKLDANLRECGEDLYKKISEAYAELKARPNFDTNAPCN